MSAFATATTSRPPASPSGCSDSFPSSSATQPGGRAQAYTPAVNRRHSSLQLPRGKLHNSSWMRIGPRAEHGWCLLGVSATCSLQLPQGQLCNDPWINLRQHPNPRQNPCAEACDDARQVLLSQADGSACPALRLKKSIAVQAGLHTRTHLHAHILPRVRTFACKSVDEHPSFT